MITFQTIKDTIEQIPTEHLTQREWEILDECGVPRRCLLLEAVFKLRPGWFGGALLVPNVIATRMISEAWVNASEKEQERLDFWYATPYSLVVILIDAYDDRRPSNPETLTPFPFAVNPKEQGKNEILDELTELLERISGRVPLPVRENIATLVNA